MKKYLIVATLFITNLVGYQNQTLALENITKESVIKTDLDSVVYINAGGSETIDSNLNFLKGDKFKDIGVIEITNSNATPGDISYIEYDHQLVDKLKLKVEHFTANGQIIFRGRIRCSDWERLFESVKFKTSSKDIYKTVKVTFTLKDSKSRNIISLGAVPQNPETPQSLTSTLEKWKSDIVKIKGYYGDIERPLNVVTTTNKSKLSSHVSTGLGVEGKKGDKGQIDWVQDYKQPNGGIAEKIVMEFSQPVTDVTVGLTGLGSRFINSAKAVYEFYYKGVLVRSRGTLDRSADFDGDGYIATNIVTTNLVVDKMVFSIEIEGNNKSNANYSVRYVTASPYIKSHNCNSDGIFTKSYIIKVVKKSFGIISQPDRKDRNITTKIVNTPFILNFSLEDGNREKIVFDENFFKTLKKSMRVYLVGDGDIIETKKIELSKGLLDKLLSLFFSSDGTSLSLKFNIPKAYRDVRAIFEVDDQNFTSDRFAIRPKEFYITSSKNEVEVDENFTISALVLDNSHTSDSYLPVVTYNGDEGVDFEIVGKKSLVNLDKVKIRNSIFTSNLIHSSTVGNIKLTISEKVGHEFAIIDENDTEDKDRLIEPSALHMIVKESKLPPLPSGKCEGIQTDGGYVYLFDNNDLFGNASEVNLSIKFSRKDRLNSTIFSYGFDGSDEVSLKIFQDRLRFYIGGEYISLPFDSLLTSSSSKISKTSNFEKEKAQPIFKLTIPNLVLEQERDYKFFGTKENRDVISEQKIVLPTNKHNQTSNFEKTDETSLSNKIDKIHDLIINWKSKSGEVIAYLDGKRIQGNFNLKSGYKIAPKGRLQFGQDFKGQFRYINISTDINSAKWDMNLIKNGKIFNVTHPVYHKYSHQMRWNDAKNLCQSQGMRLPKKSELESLKSIFKENHISGEFWTGDEISSDWAYMFRFQNNYSQTWTQSMQKINYKSVYCIGNSKEFPLKKVQNVHVINKSKDCQLASISTSFPKTGKCLGVALNYNNGDGYLLFDDGDFSNSSTPTKGYKHSRQMRWSDAKNLCQSKKMRLPKRSELESLKSIFKEKHISGEFWTDDEINSNWVYMFRFQNNYFETWTQFMQKINYKNVYCVADPHSSSLFQDVGDFNLTLQILGSLKNSSTLFSYGDNLEFGLSGKNLVLKIGDISKKVSIGANELFDETPHILKIAFLSSQGATEIYLDGKIKDVVSSKNWKDFTFQGGKKLYIGKGSSNSSNFIGEYSYIGFETPYHSVEWDMEDLNRSYIVDSKGKYLLKIFGDVEPLNSECNISDEIDNIGESDSNESEDNGSFEQNLTYKFTVADVGQTYNSVTNEQSSKKSSDKIISGYQHSTNLKWSSAQAVCKAKGMRLPKRSELESLKSIFKEKHISGEFWTDDEINSNWAYMFRFQNNYSQTWTQSMQKINYKSVYCIPPNQDITDDTGKKIESNKRTISTKIAEKEFELLISVKAYSSATNQNSNDKARFGYQHSTNLKWPSAQAVCQAKGMRLPKRSELESLKPIFKEKHISGEFWTDDEINSNWAYMFRFQNNYSQTWTQSMQKINYKSVYCIPSENNGDTNEQEVNDFNFTGSVIVSLVGVDGVAKKVVNFNNTKSEKVKFISPNISKNVGVKIEYKNDIFYSDDNFSIRPQEFNISSINRIIAGDNFSLVLKALDAKGNSVTGYNETNSTSIKFQYDEVKSGCDTGKLLEVYSISFYNGESPLKVKYSEIGKVKFQISEIDGLEFAKIDKEDTPDKDRLIAPASKEIEFNLSKISVNIELNNSMERHTYIANRLNDMNGSINFKIKAINSLGNITKNFRDGCYSEDLNLSFPLSINSQDKNLQLLVFDNSLKELNITDDEVNISTNVNKNLFKYGEYNGSIYLNFKRQTDKPINPITLSIDKSIDVSKFDSSSTVNGELLFLYARLMIDDKDVVGKTTLIHYIYEIYSDSHNVDRGLFGEMNFSPRWYEDRLANRDKLDNYIFLKDPINTQELQIRPVKTFVATKFQISLKDEESFGKNFLIDINAPKYLLYNKYDENLTKGNFEITFWKEEGKAKKDDVEDIHLYDEDILNRSLKIPSRRVEW